MRLFRQSRERKWESVILEVARELKNLIIDRKEEQRGRSALQHTES